MDLNIDELYQCKNEVEEELDRLNNKRKKGEQPSKEQVEVLYEEIETVNFLIKKVYGNK
jgi:hypothetical protein